jgi:hypothetical protein
MAGLTTDGLVKSLPRLYLISSKIIFHVLSNNYVVHTKLSLF